MESASSYEKLHNLILSFLQEKWKPLFLFALLLGLLPFIIISLFNHPWYDDFCLAAAAIERGFVGSLIYLYQQKTGLYSSIALHSLNPLVFGSFTGYKLIAPCLIILTFLATHLAIATLYKDTLLRIDQWIFSAALTLLFLHQMPTVTEGIYFATGAIPYQLPNVISLLIISISALIGRFDASKFMKSALVILAHLLTLSVVGFNFPHMVLFTLLLGFIAAACFRSNLEQKWLWLSLLIVALAGATVAITAPGNAVRSSYFPDKGRFFYSLTLSLAQVVRFSGKWLSDLPFILLTLLYIPIAARVADKSKLLKNHLYIHPLAGLVFLFVVLFVGFFPAYWSMGHLFQHRTVNVSYFWFLFCWFLNVQVMVSYLKKRGSVIIGRLPNYFPYLALPVIVIALLATGNTGRAFYDLLSGEAYYYDQELKMRYKFVKSECSISQEPCVLEPLTHKPATLYSLDITPDEKNEINECFSQYFQIKEVKLKQ